MARVFTTKTQDIVLKPHTATQVIAMNSSFVQALFNPDLPHPAELTTWNQKHVARRFDIHRNNVLSSFVDALAETFPVTMSLVGELFFRVMALEFARQHPPKSKILAFYGSNFSAFIHGFLPAADIHYLADVAHLEMQWVHCYHSADDVTLSTQVITNAIQNPEVLNESHLIFQPCVQLVQSPYAVVSLWLAHQKESGLSISTIDPFVGEQALMLRTEWQVELVPLNEVQADFFALLIQGASLGDALNKVLCVQPNFDLFEILVFLMQKKVIANIKMPTSMTAE